MTRAEKVTMLSTLDAKPTTYEVSRYHPGTTGREVPGANAKAPDRPSMWEPVGTYRSTTGADGAIRAYCELQNEKFTGGTLRAVPTSRITERDVTVETKRQVTLGAP